MSAARMDRRTVAAIAVSRIDCPYCTQPAQKVCRDIRGQVVPLEFSHFERQAEAANQYLRLCADPETGERYYEELLVQR